MNRIHTENAAWNAAQAEKCRQDPELRAMEEAGIWCNLCAMHKPCICDNQAIASKLRSYYNSQITTDWLGRTKEIVKTDCSLNDRIMFEMANIAIKEYRKMIGQKKYWIGVPKEK